MQAVIDDIATLHATDYSPTAEQTYRVRFQFDPNSLVIPANQDFSILITGTTSSNGYRLMLSDKTSGGYNLQAQARSDGGTWIPGALTEISDAPHVIEVEFIAASAAGANDGSLKLWVDDALASTLTSLDNDTRLIETAYLGAPGSLDADTSGTMFFDDFESDRTARP
jgi:hypothetical protein